MQYGNISSFGTRNLLIIHTAVNQSIYGGFILCAVKATVNSRQETSNVSVIHCSRSIPPHEQARYRASRISKSAREMPQISYTYRITGKLLCRRPRMNYSPQSKIAGIHELSERSADSFFDLSQQSASSFFGLFRKPWSKRNNLTTR